MAEEPEPDEMELFGELVRDRPAPVIDISQARANYRSQLSHQVKRSSLAVIKKAERQFGDTMAKRGDWTDEKRVEAVAYAKETSREEAAKKFGVSVTTISNWTARFKTNGSAATESNGNVHERLAVENRLLKEIVSRQDIVLKQLLELETLKRQLGA